MRLFTADEKRFEWKGQAYKFNTIARIKERNFQSASCLTFKWLWVHEILPLSITFTLNVIKTTEIYWGRFDTEKRLIWNSIWDGAQRNDAPYKTLLLYSQRKLANFIIITRKRTWLASRFCTLCYFLYPIFTESCWHEFVAPYLFSGIFER